MLPDRQGCPDRTEKYGRKTSDHGPDKKPGPRTGGPGIPARQELTFARAQTPPEAPRAIELKRKDALPAKT